MSPKNCPFLFLVLLLVFFLVTLIREFLCDRGPALTVTVHPFPSNEAFAASPAAPGAEDVPPSMLTMPFDCPAVSRDTKILSTDCWERAQLNQALVKLIAEQLSNIPAGNVVRLVQAAQAPPKFVPELTSRKGKEVRLVQLFQVLLKVSPELTLSGGKEDKLVQFPQASSKLVPELKFKVPGKVVKLVHCSHV